MKSQLFFAENSVDVYYKSIKDDELRLRHVCHTFRQTKIDYLSLCIIKSSSSTSTGAQILGETDRAFQYYGEGHFKGKVVITVEHNENA